MKFTALFLAGIFITASFFLQGGWSLSALESELERWRVKHQTALHQAHDTEETEVLELTQEAFAHAWMKDQQELSIQGRKYDIVHIAHDAESKMVRVTVVADHYEDWLLELFEDHDHEAPTTPAFTFWKLTADHPTSEAQLKCSFSLCIDSSTLCHEGIVRSGFCAASSDPPEVA